QKHLVHSALYWRLMPVKLIMPGSCIHMAEKIQPIKNFLHGLKKVRIEVQEKFWLPAWLMMARKTDLRLIPYPNCMSCCPFRLLLQVVREAWDTALTSLRWVKRMPRWPPAHFTLVRFRFRN